MPGLSASGENKAWDILADLDPGIVCSAAAVMHDPASDIYRVRSFGTDFHASRRDIAISCDDPQGAVLLGRLGDFFRLSLLWYLAGAKDIPCTGRLVKLQGIKGGEIFTKGSHILPLGKLADKYGKNRDGFIEKGKSLNGEVMNIGDASMRLLPFPRIPIVIALWLEDDEFPARADLMLDSSCEIHLPTDIIWSIAMMSVLIML